MKLSKLPPLLLAACLLLSGCRGPEAPASEELPSPPSPSTPQPSPSLEPSAVFDPSQLSLQELVGQLLVVGVEGTSPGEDARRAIQDFHAGGVILFSHNVDSAQQLTAFTNGLKALNSNPLPLFLCVDQEGGRVSRMPSEVAALPAAYDYIQAGGDPGALGQVLGWQCAAFGFNVDCAPVLDVWSNPANTVIGKRAMAKEADTAAACGAQAVQALAQQSVIPVGKHFPGHGDTQTDSHVGLPQVDKTLEELEQLELIPFRQAMDNGLEAVMVSHILLSQIDPDLPASLSPAVVTRLLREELGFQGVVFTDDLTMGAITQSWDMGQAAVLAVQAGCDLVLVCHGADNLPRPSLRRRERATQPPAAGGERGAHLGLEEGLRPHRCAH